MTRAEQIDRFFKSTEQTVFIEAEAKASRISSFIREYNSKYSPSISANSEGIISLNNDANKWGLELRCYFDDRLGFPAGVKTTSNRAYRSEYSYRFNDVDIIWELFDLGYRIGMN